MALHVNTDPGAALRGLINQPNGVLGIDEYGDVVVGGFTIDSSGNVNGYSGVTFSWGHNEFSIDENGSVACGSFQIGSGDLAINPSGDINTTGFINAGYINIGGGPFTVDSSGNISATSISLGGGSFTVDHYGYVGAVAVNADTFSGSGLTITDIFVVTTSAATSGTVSATGTSQEETINLTSGSTIVSLTIDLTSIPDNGKVRIHSKSAITTLTVTATGLTFEDAALTTLAAGGNATFQRWGSVIIRIQ